MAAKGISLPFTTIVVISISLFVLVVVGGLFLLQSGSSFGRISSEAAYGEGCVTQLKDCNRSPADINLKNYFVRDVGSLVDRPGTLFDACKTTGRAAGTTPTDQISACKKSCGCSG